MGASRASFIAAILCPGAALSVTFSLLMQDPQRHKSAAQQITATAEPHSARLLQTSPDAGDVSGRMDKKESAAAVSHV
jgi:hypothetical protein